ncbi:MAG: hypothetical protein ACI9FZ_000951 [Bacteroidia bacterium]|jgi:hypothetical protein
MNENNFKLRNESRRSSPSRKLAAINCASLSTREPIAISMYAKNDRGIQNLQSNAEEEDIASSVGKNKRLYTPCAMLGHLKVLGE